MNALIDFISQPWPWYVGGPLIGLVILLLVWIDNKPLAISSSYRHLCAATFPARVKFLQYDWKKETWNLVFVLGVFLGGLIAGTILHHPDHIAIADETARQLTAMGLKNTDGFLPDIFSFAGLATLPGFIMIVVGGFMVGFGTRYAGGCTSGHSMTGISNLQWTSLLATACFFIGGIISSNFLLPIVLKL